ncbi:MAG TPA: hypothetical protein VKQ70_14405 [Caulobacteraceae bacterium]|jgi:hypothetical protein|nr:hypothetical protein [Caulobacteraceae bacterium]
MPSRRQVAFISSVAVAVVGAIVIWFGAAAVVTAIYGRDVRAAAPWLALAKFASLGWAAVVGWAVTWPRLDERERATRKFTWFVGSTAAILATAPIMLFWLVNGGEFLAQLLRRGTPGAYFALGWVGLVVAQLLGALIARAGLWAKNR